MTKFNEDNKKSPLKSESIIFIELSNFSLLGGTSSILVTFLGGTSKKNHPVYYDHEYDLTITNIFSRGVHVYPPLCADVLSLKNSPTVILSGWRGCHIV